MRIQFFIFLFTFNAFLIAQQVQDTASITTTSTQLAAQQIQNKQVRDTSSVRCLPFQAGDALEISIYPDSTTFPSGLYPIDGEGYADLPSLGYIKVTKMTAKQLEDTLKSTFAEFMRYPLLKVRPLYRLIFSGGFQRPGLYWVDPHWTFSQTLQLAGTTSRPDGIKLLQWERNRLPISKDLIPMIQSGNSLYQLGLKSGDQITVTALPDRTGWEVFRMEVLPVLTVSLSTIVTAATVYQTYRLMRYGHE
jgi:polysaccharide export outer membrane protein